MDLRQQYGQLVYARVMSYGLLSAIQESDQQQVEQAFRFSAELLLASIEESSQHPTGVST